MVSGSSVPDGAGTVSIIIPVHGQTKLSRCIAAVESQTYRNIEIVKVTSKGFPAEKRNYGFQISKGEFVFFLDEDEYLSSSTVEQCLKKATEGFDVVSVPVVKLPAKNYLANCVSLLRENTYKSMFFRRSVLEKHGLFDPEFVLCDDLDLLERLRQKSIQIGTIHSSYMLHEENDSVRDIFAKTLLARRSFRQLKKKYGNEVYRGVVGAARHRRRIFGEVIRRPHLFPGVLLIMAIRFFSRRIP